MAVKGNRTVLCSVVFIDIVEYSKMSVEQQMQIKQQFNALLLRALDGVPADDRIILDTGDGAAINFLGDPEECLFVALGLRDALGERRDDTLRLRIGINLGPVRLVKDINGQPNIIGDGINVAQRIMTFADVNQILVSRSFYELISALSADYAQQFAFEGARTDKHVREHEVYALGRAPTPRRVQRKPPLVPAATRATAALRKLEFAAASVHAHIMRRPPLATALAVGLILALAVALRLTLRDADDGAVTELAGQPAVQAAPPPSPAPPSLQPRSLEPEKKRLPEPVADAPAAPAAKPIAEPPPAEVRPRPPAPAATGHVRLNIVPWGEVYVDGQKFGVTPPLHDLALSAGSHRIEIRNPGFPSHVQVVEVKAREEIRIRHRFQ